MFLIWVQANVLPAMIGLSEKDKRAFRDHGIGVYYLSLSVVCVSLCLSLAMSSFVGYLSLYHAYINFKGISTYEHVLMKSKKIGPEPEAGRKSVTQIDKVPIVPGSESFKLEHSVRQEDTFLLKN